MALRRSARIAALSNLRNNANANANATAPTQNGVQQQQQQQQQPPKGLMKLPGELRNKVYDLIARRQLRLILDCTESAKVTGPFQTSLLSVNHAIRGEFLNRIAETHHTTRIYLVKIQDFDFSTLIDHLRPLNRAATAQRIVIRHFITSAAVDSAKVLAWLEFVQGKTFTVEHKIWGLPAVAERRKFMMGVYGLQRDIQPHWPDVKDMVDAFSAWWDQGRGEMRWAQDGEDPPGGPGWLEDAGMDVDSNGEED